MKYLFLLFFIVFTGCQTETYKIQTPDNGELAGANGRFEVKKVQSFLDYDAYNGSRSIFIITDTNSNKEYIGISGVGISELGSHMVGKTHITDER